MRQETVSEEGDRDSVRRRRQRQCQKKEVKRRHWKKSDRSGQRQALFHALTLPMISLASGVSGV